MFLDQRGRIVNLFLSNQFSVNKVGFFLNGMLILKPVHSHRIQKWSFLLASLYLPPVWGELALQPEPCCVHWCWNTTFRCWGLCIMDIKSLQTDWWKPCVGQKKNSFLSCNICIEALFEHWVFVFDKLQYSVSRVLIQSLAILAVLSCSSVCSPHFATTVPQVSVGLFALLWPYFSELHNKQCSLTLKNHFLLFCILLNDFAVVLLILVRWRQNLLEAILPNLKRAVKRIM